MNIWPLNNISDQERENILSKHRELYNGYTTVHQPIKEQPLYVQDYANDKNGVTVTNKGVVKTYTNYGINENEKKKEELCDKCGSMIMDGVCSECGEKKEKVLYGSDTSESLTEERKHIIDFMKRLKIT